MTAVCSAPPAADKNLGDNREHSGLCILTQTIGMGLEKLTFMMFISGRAIDICYTVAPQNTLSRLNQIPCKPLKVVPYLISSVIKCTLR